MMIFPSTCNGMDYVAYTNRGFKGSRRFKIGPFIKVDSVSDCKTHCDATPGCKSFEAKYKNDKIHCLLRNVASYEGQQRVPRRRTTLYEKCNLCEQPTCEPTKLTDTFRFFTDARTTSGCEGNPAQSLREKKPANGYCTWESQFLALPATMPNISNVYVTFKGQERGILEISDIIDVQLRACPEAKGQGCSRYVPQVRMRNDLPPLPPPEVEDIDSKEYASWSPKALISGEPVDDGFGISQAIIDNNISIVTDSISRDFWWDGDADPAYKYIQIRVRLRNDVHGLESHNLDDLTVWGSCDNYQYPLGKCSQQCEIEFLKMINRLVKKGKSEIAAWIETRTLVDTFPISGNTGLLTACVPGCTTTAAMLAYLPDNMDSTTPVSPTSFDPSNVKTR